MIFFAKRQGTSKIWWGLSSLLNIYNNKINDIDIIIFDLARYYYLNLNLN